MHARQFSFALALISIPLAAQTSPQSAQITLTTAVVTAGQHVDIPVDLGVPVACDSTVLVWFSPKAPGGPELEVAGGIVKGHSSVTIRGDIPMDQPGGDYTSTRAVLQPCPGYSYGKQLKTTSSTLTVKPIPDTIQYPTTAVVKLSLTESQFLDTKTAELNELRNKLENGLADNASNTLVLNAFLTGIVTDALKDLRQAEDQYDHEILKGNGPLPPFFGDFRSRYEKLLSELAAFPKSNRAASDFSHPASLVYVQELKKRDDTPPPGGEWSAIANDVWHAIKEQIAAYVHVRSTGRVTFKAVLLSFPIGARVQYKRVYEDVYLDYSSPTDVSNAEFDLVRWEFKFLKEGCKDQHIQINPYEEKEPVTISVELNCKKR